MEGDPVPTREGFHGWLAAGVHHRYSFESNTQDGAVK